MKAATPLYRKFTVVALSIILTGCASMSEKECLSVDWRDQGYRDGLAGQPPSRVEDHREACSKVGVVPNIEQYTSGRSKGIVEYCTPQNAAREGRRGHSYRNACPPELEMRFLDNYRAGRRVYDAEQRVNNLNNQLQDAQRKLDREKDDGARKRLREDLRRLDDQLRRARDEVYDADRRLQYR